MRGLAIIRCAALALALGGNAAAAEALPLLSAQPDGRAERILGQPVYTADGVRHGRVTALVARRGRVVGAVVRHGGVLGLFHSETLVPADQIATVNTDVVVLRWSSSELAAAPEAETALAGDQTLKRME